MYPLTRLYARKLYRQKLIYIFFACFFTASFFYAFLISTPQMEEMLNINIGIVSHSGITYASVSFVIAVGQILYGATQPFFGMLAIRKSNAFVMFLGIVLMAAGLIITPFCNSLWSLLLFFGILLPAGTGALCFGIVMGALAPIIGERRAAVVSGIVQASAGIGDAVILTLTVYGIFTMFGAVITGFSGQKFRTKNVLAGVYGIRIFIALAFIWMPKSIPFAFAATAMLGITGDSTVPPTTSIISGKVGVAKMAVVYGSIFIGHQLGAFVSAWLGGVLVSTSPGYTALWIVDLCLCITAFAASFAIPRTTFAIELVR